MTNLNNGLNNELMLELTSLGYQVEEQGNKLKVKLGGLAYPIYIDYDLCKNQFIVNTRDIINSAFSIAWLFFALNNTGWKQALLLCMAVFYLLSLVLTELKSQPLKQRVRLFNKDSVAKFSPQ
ncbi:MULTISPECIES: hypothetical protein [unclassified Shewanella]|uniref:hypothetical protein n=1 Tax=unclassified Shewanella TaxID=196818 RepID=UPI001BC4D8FB|nr:MULTISPECIES: hypothetical protein [unclassified Shewanella]GIU10353.1 hypothetical protein TUM4444_14510 [Shewanella sp. MBTL60-112-B1]GIU32409.1 hypothetical protein TUM4445_18040 [Shewanella sp. MBTL60-112-B2]